MHGTISARDLVSPFAFFQPVQHDIVFVPYFTTDYKSFVLRSKAVESQFPKAFRSNLFKGKVYILPDDDFLGKLILPIIVI